MRTKIASLASDSAIYGAGMALTKFANVLMQPVLVHVFSTVQYGLTDFTYVVILLASMVCLVGIDSAFAFYYYRCESDAERLRLATTAVSARVGQAAIATAVIVAVAPWGSRFLTGEPGHAPLVILAACILPGAAGVAAVQDVMRVTFRPVAFGVFSLCNVVLNFGVTLALLLVWHVGPAGVFWGRIVADALAFGGGLLAVRASLGGGMSWVDHRKMLRYGAPLIASAVSYWLVGYVDRWFLQNAHGMRDVGIYSFAGKLGMVVLMVVNAFVMAWGPYCYAMADHPDVKQTMARVAHLYVLCAGLLATAITIFATEALRLLAPPAYGSGAAVVGFLAFGNAIYGGYYVAGMAVNMAGKTQHLGWTASCGAAAAILLAWQLVGPYGMTGVAIGTLGGYVAAVSMVALVARRVYPLPVRWVSVLIFLGVCGAACAALLRVELPLGPAIALKLAVLAGLLALAFPLKLTKWNDVLEARRAAAKLRAKLAGAA